MRRDVIWRKILHEIILGNHRKRMLTFFREITGGVTGSCGYHLLLITFWNLLIINYATTCDLTENLRENILGNHRKRMLTFFSWNCRWAHRKLWPPLKVNGNSCQEIVRLWDKFSPLETIKLSCLVTSNGWFGTLKKHFTSILGKFNLFKNLIYFLKLK